MIAVLVQLAGCPIGPPALEGIGEAKLTRNLWLLELDVEIDGKPVPLIVDTGASVTSITRKTAAAAGVRVAGETQINGTLYAATGRIDQLAFVGLAIPDLPVAVIDLPIATRITKNYAGILGLDVLARFDIVLDLRHRSLTVLRAGTAKTQVSDAVVKLPIRYSRDGLVIVDVMFGGRRVPAVLDTGATSSVMSPHTLPNRDPVEVTDELHTGGISFGLRSLAVTPHPIFARSGLAGQPAILLGLDILRDRQLVLAYHDRALYISR